MAVMAILEMDGEPDALLAAVAESYVSFRTQPDGYRVELIEHPTAEQTRG